MIEILCHSGSLRVYSVHAKRLTFLPSETFAPGVGVQKRDAQVSGFDFSNYHSTNTSCSIVC